MTYRITITKVDGAPGAEQKLYEQVVEEIDMHAVMSAVNKKPRKPRSKGEKKDDK